MPNSPDYTARRRKLIRSLSAAKVDSLLVTNETNVRYLTGFTGDSTWLFLSKRDQLIFSDTRYTTQLKSECAGLDVEIRDARVTMNEAVAKVLGKLAPKAVGFESASLTVAQHKGLLEAADSLSFTATSGLVEKLRTVKDKWELQQIRDAVTIAERGISVVRSSLTPNQTEKDVRYLLEAAMRSFGGNGTAFEPIIGVGPTGALPHAHAGDLRISESPMLLVDWGAETKSGYRSDITRCFVTGKPTKQMELVYKTVLGAQQKAIKAIKPGADCAKIDKIARGHIDRAGFGNYFGHGLGHGIGLDIHESSRLSPLAKETLEPGMVVTVEPGIYLPGKFGVRIEDDVLVTKDGYEVLTSVPREVDEAFVEFLA